jgi:tetratricopeptide (TPR) repeat protein
VYRAMRLTYMGRAGDGQALMDSCLAAWRKEDYYQQNEKSHFSIDYLDRKFDALVADVADDPETAARLWRRVVDLGTDTLAFREMWYDHYRLAAALQAGGKPQEALTEHVEPILAMNPRIINVLVLATKCYLDLGRVEDARQALDQLTWSVANADADFPPRAEAEELAQRVAALERNP